MRNSASSLQFAGVELYFDDLERAKKFYCGLLRLELEEEDPQHHIKLKLGERFLCLEKKGVEGYPSADKAVIFFEVDDLAEFVGSVGEGRIVQSGPNAAAPAWIVLHDPEDHNILVLQK
jgi:predicted enzyme related to lactoylglutathione lyase